MPAHVASSWGGAVVAVAAVAAAMLCRRTWGLAARSLAAVVLVGAVVATMLVDPLPAWALVGFAVGMPALAVLLSPGSATTSTTPVASARSLATGAMVFTVLLFAFYAGYGLGHRADVLVVGVAVVITVAALLPLRRAGEVTGTLLLRRGAVAVVVAAALVAVGPLITVRELPAAPPQERASVRLAVWNTQTGYGMDGTWLPAAVAAMLRGEGADVVLLSEVDRGWLLNGGQEQLTVLARLLGYHLAFGPAGDQV